MLPIHYGTLDTPPSSPPSPCSTWVNSSSPPSSPVIEPLSLDVAHDDERDLPRQTRLHMSTDPLAGSYNANRVKAITHISQKRLCLDVQLSTPHFDPEKTPKAETATSREELLWDRVNEAAFKTGNREIDLTNLSLTKIPPRCIQDLSKMVVLPETREPSDGTRNNWPSVKPVQPTNGRRAFTRIQTAPASTIAGWPQAASTSQGKSRSSNSILGASKEDVHLYLGLNNIKRLPAELWTLQHLTILSLRSNDISYLPPEIEQLQNLETLNIANNKLRYIPSELMRMKTLQTLLLFPNPFMERPPGPQDVAPSVSETEYTGSRVPSLLEITQRILLFRPMDLALSPPHPSKTILEEFYNLPLVTGNPYRPISNPLRRTLSTCVPGSITVDGNLDEDVDSNGIGRCPNPAHGTMPAIFVQPAERRYTWQKKIGELHLGGETAVLWRGCQRGCLDFLGPPKVDLGAQSTPTEEEEVDWDSEVIVRTIRFESSAELDFD